MPWTVKDVDEHKKGLGDAQKKAWVKIANSSLKRCLDDGGKQDECEGRAIRIANAMASRVKEANMGKDTMIEAATVKARVQGLLKAADDLLKDKELPVAVKKQIRAMRDGLKQRWEKMADGDGSDAGSAAVASAEAERWLAEAGRILRQSDSLIHWNDMLSMAVRERFGSDDRPVWVRDFFPDAIIFDLAGVTMQVTYSIDRTGREPKVIFGEPAEVEMAYIPVGDSQESLQEAAIAPHKTATDTESDWDGPKATADAPNDAKVLKYMHAWVDSEMDADLKGAYKFPHHLPRVGSAANIRGVNNAHARLANARIPQDDKPGVSRHLRKHRVDAGLEETMSEAEIREAVLEITEDDGLSFQDAHVLFDTVLESEQSRREPGIDLIEGSDLIGDIQSLSEAVIGADGTIPMRIIRPGWGSSGYYSPDVLKRDGPRVFHSGMQMFWDHPGRSEESDRPERSLRDLAGVLVEDAKWREDGANGPGLFARAKVFGDYAGHLKELAPHIGVSIRAKGKISEGEAEGKRGKVVQELTAGRSVDFVTVAGAGGKVVDLFESARSGNPKKEGNEVEMTEIETRLQAVEAENRRLKETTLLHEAREIVQVTLAKATLPDVTKARLLESLSANPPIKEDALDTAALDTRIQDAVKTEAQYLSQVTGSVVRGLGATSVAPTGALKESFREMYRRQGMTPEEAERLAALAAA